MLALVGPKHRHDVDGIVSPILGRIGRQNFAGDLLSQALGDRAELSLVSFPDDNT